jgi:fluoride ion exporter CrcB/FEX
VILTHRSGRFPCGFLSVRVVGDLVIGMFADGSEVETGWDAFDAEYFANRGLWVPLEVK